MLVDKFAASLQTAVHVETLSTASDVGAGAINLAGNALGNQIIGNAGANVLRGLDGNDDLLGDAAPIASTSTRRSAPRRTSTKPWTLRPGT